MLHLLIDARSSSQHGSIRPRRLRRFRCIVRDIRPVNSHATAGMSRDVGNLIK